MLSRRKFLQRCLTAPFVLKEISSQTRQINTVLGAVNPARLGKTLIHEHVLVDFIGADKINPDRWEHEKVIRRVLPFLKEIKAKGIQSIVECTPAYLGRDVLLLQKLSRLSGLNILTNTGYYGASDNKYLPKQAFTETAEQLAERWINEFYQGIDNTEVKPGFIKISVNPGSLSTLHQKLVVAAGLTHLETGLTICSHTGPSLPAFEEIAILDELGVHPSAFVWVHARSTNENDFLKAAKMGVWISLDGISKDNLAQNASILQLLKSHNLLNRALISHDAGWYKPGEENGGEFRGFTTITDHFIPLLKTKAFTEEDIKQLIIINPAEVFTIKKRKL
ncbi:phosphotriesterase-related protein [Dyadobacter koreensis]|uniref:Phosphotriesterase-related protein n=1 Tax=Dyadobacter koreensis TaxID=408657 RepID=A0A1H6S7T5_9BACT|nr:aryldialkylphosphatase [Dyadobacter koreensis]SEI59775.1 phosphotriesterase-related protein [Dyadobacter koreensis]